MLEEKRGGHAADVTIGEAQDHLVTGPLRIEQDRVCIEREQIEHALLGLRMEGAGAIVAQPERRISRAAAFGPRCDEGVRAHLECRNLHGNVRSCRKGRSWVRPISPAAVGANPAPCHSGTTRGAVRKQVRGRRISWPRKLWCNRCLDKCKTRPALIATCCAAWHPCEGWIPRSAARTA